MMKNKQIILFFCLFTFTYKSTCAQQQDSVAPTNRFKININPCLMVSQLELGAMFEYRLGKHFSVEAGGGVHPEGYTIRTGLRFYFKHDYYFKSVFFYRHLIKKSERNLWIYTNNDTAQGHIDTGFNLTVPAADGDGFLSVTAHDNKQVFAMEFLAGRELYRRKFLVDIYFGIGYR